MPERTAEEIRKQIADERLGLHEDLDALKAELHSRVPYLIGVFVGIVLLAAGLFTAVRRIRQLL